jgi:hypothetical protein
MGPLLMLVFRAGSFAVFQALIAGIYALQSHPTPWEASAAWWPITATLTNLLCLVLLAWLCQREGIRLVDLYRVERHPVRRELLVFLGISVVGMPLALVPNIGLGTLQFGNMQVPGEMLFRPLPMVVPVPSLLLFLVTNALAEVPTFYSYG